MTVNLVGITGLACPVQFAETMASPANWIELGTATLVKGQFSVNYSTDNGNGFCRDTDP